MTRDARDIALPFDVNIFQAGPHAINRTGRLFGSRAKQSRMAPDARTMKYRIQFEWSLSPDNHVFDSEREAFDWAMSQWPEGGWWVISEE